MKVHANVRMLVLLSALLACIWSAPAAADDTGRATVVWISVDGLRADYLERAEAPFLQRIMRDGAYTTRLVPVFPSLTFPSHVSQATGVTPDQHGIMANNFFDAETGQAHNFPGDAALLQAEPIWITAQRQGVRTAVLDWPLSHNQQGPVRTDLFAPAFQRDLTDTQRLERLTEFWTHDGGEAPLRLIMGYISKVDSTGHQFGPDSPEVVQALRDADEVLRAFHERAVELFERTKRQGDELYFIITTDHGMAPVHSLVNFDALFEPRLPKTVRVVTSGSMAMVHLGEVEAAGREQVRKQILQTLEKQPFLRAWPREMMPREYGFDHPTRGGDIVVALHPGHAFSTRLPQPTFAVETVKGPLGMHGYGVDESDLMLGAALISRHGDPLGGIDLGEVHSLQLHPTIARILNIDPSEGASAEPLQLAPAEAVAQ